MEEIDLAEKKTVIIKENASIVLPWGKGPFQRESDIDTEAVKRLQRNGPREKKRLAVKEIVRTQAAFETI